MDETEALATFISDCAIDDLPEEVRERARTTIRDTLGVALYASTEPFGDQITEYISDTAPGEEATILGVKRRVPPALPSQMGRLPTHRITTIRSSP